MKPQILSLEQAVRIATQKNLPAGFKPEDYYWVGDQIPLKIASLIVKEALHLVAMSKRQAALGHGSQTSLL